LLEAPLLEELSLEEPLPGADSLEAPAPEEPAPGASGADTVDGCSEAGPWLEWLIAGEVSGEDVSVQRVFIGTNGPLLAH
jgi:hypothetical protein